MEAQIKVLENEKTIADKCAEEVDYILQKYGCTLICRQQEMFGQVVWIPIVVEVKK